MQMVTSLSKKIHLKVFIFHFFLSTWQQLSFAVVVSFQALACVLVRKLNKA